MIYRFNAITFKIPARIFVDIDKVILKFIRKSKGTVRTKTILKEKNKATVIKTVWHWWRNRHTN